jgi:predicted ATP-grasp superfamily ATP-dependent carboligase
MKLKRHKFKYLAYVFDVEAGMTLVPIECYLEYVLPIDVEHLELAFERTKEQLAKAEEQLEEAEERADFLSRQIG